MCVGQLFAQKTTREENTMSSKLVAPHGGKGLVCALLEGAAREAELKKAAGLKQVEVSDRAKGDLIMMGIGGSSRLTG